MRLDEIVASIDAHVRSIREARTLAAENPEAVKPLRTLSPELRARLTKAQRMRWARKRAAKAA